MKLKHWVALFVMSFAGEFAWGIQSQIFNLFMFNKIAPRPILISTMVFVGAVVATITAIVMGALSDEKGKRKPFILAGYLLWGIFIAFFPLTQHIPVPVAAVLAVILINGLMSYFRATAYEASYHAYLTDITNLKNRGTAQGVASLGLCFAMLATFSGLDFIDSFDKSINPLVMQIKGLGFDSFSFFFLIVGIVVIIMGSAGGLIVEDSGIPAGGEMKVLNRIKSTFKKDFFKVHKNYFLVLLAMGLFMMSFNAFFQFVLIYLQHYLKIPIDKVGLMVLTSIIIGGMVFSIPAGILCDRYGRKKIAVAAILVESIFLFAFAFARDLIWLGIFACFWVGAQTAWMVASYAWSKDLYPEEKRAEFSGYMTIFQIGIGGGLGAYIGGVIAELHGVQGIIDGRPGIIPDSAIFVYAAILVLLPLIPVLKAAEKES
ncbi:MAG: MFS transporter [Bacillota bacterium]